MARDFKDDSTNSHKLQTLQSCTVSPSGSSYAILTTSFNSMNSHLPHSSIYLPSRIYPHHFLIFWSSLLTAFLIIHLPQPSLYLKVTTRVILLKMSLGFLSCSSYHLDFQFLLLPANFYSSFNKAFHDPQLVIHWSCFLHSPALITPPHFMIICFHNPFSTSLWDTIWQGRFPIISFIPSL